MYGIELPVEFRREGLLGVVDAEVDALQAAWFWEGKQGSGNVEGVEFACGKWEVFG